MDKIDANQTMDLMHSAMRHNKDEGSSQQAVRMLDDSEFEIEHVENQTIMLDQSDLQALQGIMPLTSKGAPQIGHSAGAMARTSLIEKYRHKGLNTLYYLKAGTP